MYPVKEIDGVTARLGSSNTNTLVPLYSAIPDEFKQGYGPWNKLQQRWFFEGLPKTTEFVPNENVDRKKAMKHLAAVQRCFDLQHEHKEAAVAYLMSQWFEDVKIDGKSIIEKR